MPTLLLVLATVVAGLNAGLFAGFAYAVLPGLRRAGDWTLVTAMRQINTAIRNPVFLVLFLGAPVLTALAAASHLPDERRAALPWILVALGFSLLTVAITGARNVPLNDQLATGGEVDEEIDAAAARARFDRPWARWNVLRAVTATAAVAALALALPSSG